MLIVVIAVVGITSSLEGEEMPVTEPGFLGGDRTSIDLPAAGGGLVEAMSPPPASRSPWC
jgi:beta-glucosidase